MTAPAIRRSVSVPRDVFDQAMENAPPELQGNFNGLAVAALREYAARRKAEALAAKMAKMAADPAVREACESIYEAFAVADADGLAKP